MAFLIPAAAYIITSLVIGGASGGAVVAYSKNKVIDDLA